MTIPEQVSSRPALGPDITDVIREDHRRARATLERLNSTRDAVERAEGFHELVSDLSRHEAAEEQVVYPLLRTLGPEAEAVRRRRLAEEREAKRLLAKMMRETLVLPESRAFETNLEKLATMVIGHAAAEEAEVLPLLADKGDATKLRVWATFFEHAKSLAPTRPHPRGPDRLPGLLLTGPVVAMADRLRDGARRLLRVP